ncbi:MAG: hypothetical protein FWG66_16285 [Spirochaetes bacterium]|nr:hypothetical protein [Spirochaetota bacterium]
MTIIDIIAKQWQEEKLPVINGLVKTDGSFYRLGTEGLLPAVPIDLSQTDYNEEFSFITEIASLEHSGRKYYCGEGSHGSDGWLLATSAGGKIEWLFFDEVNPFEKLWVANNEIHVMSNLNTEWIFPIDKPEEMRFVERKP